MKLGLVPEATVDVIHREPFEGPLRVRVHPGPEHVLDEALAQSIWVADPAAGKKPGRVPLKQVS
jgi:Fe2+ transport system protein FeoA